MKKIFTSFVLFLLGFSYVQSQTILWGGPNDPNSSFAGGFNSWTTKGLSSSNPDSAKNAVWVYSATADPKNSAFSTDLRQMKSPTATNGAIIFNSDFLDNGGNENNQGRGAAPSGHSGALISPIIDCSGFGSVALSFYQYYRNFDSHCYVEVSTDNGANWKGRTEVNGDVEFEGLTASNSRKIVDFTSLVQGEVNVQFRFVFDGDYYFWLVDDVTLVSLPENDLSILKTYYPVSSYKQPLTQICNQGLLLKSVIGNSGGAEQHDVKLKTEILESNKTTVVASTESSLASIKTSEDNVNIVTPALQLNNLKIGKYYIRTTLSSSSSTADFNLRDNTNLDSFEVSEVEFAKEPRPVYGIRANGGTAYANGALYQTSNCWGANDKFKATGVDFALAVNTLGTLNGYKANVYLAKVNSDVLPDWSNFSKDFGIDNNPSITVLTKESWTGTNQSNLDMITQLLNGSTGIALEADSRYFVILDYPEEGDVNNSDTWKFQAASNEKNYQNRPFNTVAIDNQGKWFELGWPDGEAPVARLKIAVEVKTDEHPLSDDVIRIQPNLVKAETNVDLKFDVPTNVNLTIFDVTGEVISFSNHKNVTEKKIQINTSNYKPGQYFARVTNNEGSKTVKFVVVK